MNAQALTTSDRVNAVVAECLALSVEEVDPQKTFEAMGGDSLNQAEIVIGVEEDFGLAIPDHEAEQLRTVDQIVAYVEKQKA